MIRVIAKILIKEEKIDTLIETCKELVEISRKDEGNIGYTFNVSVENPRLFAMIENWKDQASLEAHMKQPHFLKAMAVIKECAEGESAIELFREV